MCDTNSNKKYIELTKQLLDGIIYSYNGLLETSCDFRRLLINFGNQLSDNDITDEEVQDALKIKYDNIINIFKTNFEEYLNVECLKDECITFKNIFEKTVDDVRKVYFIYQNKLNDKVITDNIATIDNISFDCIEDEITLCIPNLELTILYSALLDFTSCSVLLQNVDSLITNLLFLETILKKNINLAKLGLQLVCNYEKILL
jgi:hypothetical protein